MLTISLKTTFLSFIVFLLFAGSFITSLFFKENLLWMDETLSYLVISDASLAHMNDAVVSGFEQTPPFFANLFWLIAHTVSLNIVFLKAVSIIFFAITIAFFLLLYNQHHWHLHCKFLFNHWYSSFYLLKCITS